jgi:hypothetical protein
MESEAPPNPRELKLEDSRAVGEEADKKVGSSCTPDIVGDMLVDNMGKSVGCLLGKAEGRLLGNLVGNIDISTVEEVASVLGGRMTRTGSSTLGHLLPKNS